MEETIEERVMKKELRQEACAVLAGGYDLHAHSAPSHVPRVVDDFQLVSDAASLQMAGVLIKNHYESTGSRAALVNEINRKKEAEESVCPTTAYGGIVLNWPVGGLNPYAVESALRLGSRMVWMPTRDAENSLVYGDMPGDFFSRPGISILDDSGKLLPAVREIIEIVGQHEAVLATGHLFPRESVVLCQACAGQHVKAVLTHPEWQRTKIPLDTQLELARLGVYIEKSWLNIAENDCTAEYMAHTIRSLGPEHVFLTTDCGKLGQPAPAEGMLQFIELLLEAGFSAEELHTMAAAVPAALIR